MSLQKGDIASQVYFLSEAISLVNVVVDNSDKTVGELLKHIKEQFCKVFDKIDRVDLDDDDFNNIMYTLNTYRQAYAFLKTGVIVGGIDLSMRVEELIDTMADISYEIMNDLAKMIVMMHKEIFGEE